MPDNSTLFRCQLLTHELTPVEARCALLFATVMNKNINFVSAFVSANGKSFQVDCEETAMDFMAATTRGGGSTKKCLHTFYPDKLHMLGLDPETHAALEQLLAENKRGKQHRIKFATPIPAAKVFGTACKILVLEALGTDKALELGILRIDRNTGQINPVNERESRKTLQNPSDPDGPRVPVTINGEYVYRDCRIVPDVPTLQDVYVSTVQPAVPTLLETGPPADLFD